MLRKASNCIFVVAVMVAARISHALDGKYILLQLVASVECLTFQTCQICFDYDAEAYIAIVTQNRKNSQNVHF